MKILFVCTGNTCRSPMAEGLFSEIIRARDIEGDSLTVMSAGLATIDGLQANIYAIKTLSDKGIDISGHLSQMLTVDMLEEADLILTMTNAHKISIIGKAKRANNKTFTLKEYAYREDSNMDIEDPFGKEIGAYQQCAEEILTALESIAKKIIGERI